MLVDTQFFSRRGMLAALVAAVLCGLPGRGAVAQPDPLLSWNEGAAKTSIVGLVARVTREGGPDFVAPAERIAVFDDVFLLSAIARESSRPLPHRST